MMVFLLSCVLALLMAPAHVAQPSDTLYTARAAMLIYGTDPERALTIIDSARIVGNVDAFEADLNRQWGPEMSLTDVAQAVGFTPSTFRDQFKRHFGMTPTEFRQNL